MIRDRILWRLLILLLLELLLLQIFDSPNTEKRLGLSDLCCEFVTFFFEVVEIDLLTPSACACEFCFARETRFLLCVIISATAASPGRWRRITGRCWRLRRS